MLSSFRNEQLLQFKSVLLSLNSITVFPDHCLIILISRQQCGWYPPQISPCAAFGHLLASWWSNKTEKLKRFLNVNLQNNQFNIYAFNQNSGKCLICKSHCDLPPPRLSKTRCQSFRRSVSLAIFVIIIINSSHYGLPQLAGDDVQTC